MGTLEGLLVGELLHCVDIDATSAGSRLLRCLFHAHSPPVLTQALPRGGWFSTQ